MLIIRKQRNLFLGDQSHAGNTPPRTRGKWLNKEITDPLDALMFLELTKDSEMEEYEVSREVNKPGNEGAGLIEKA
jgi:putative SOS response-associated peptidase YedK